MIKPTDRPSCVEVYEAIITGDQNPVVLRFRYLQEAEHFQRLFYAGLIPENSHVWSEANFSPTDEYKEQIILTFWR